MLFDVARGNAEGVEAASFVLAVASRPRLPNRPNVPTLEEAGVPGYGALVGGIVAPRQRPRRSWPKS